MNLNANPERQRPLDLFDVAVPEAENYSEAFLTHLKQEDPSLHSEYEQLTLKTPEERTRLLGEMNDSLNDYFLKEQMEQAKESLKIGEGISKKAKAIFNSNNGMPMPSEYDKQFFAFTVGRNFEVDLPGINYGNVQGITDVLFAKVAQGEAIIPELFDSYMRLLEFVYHHYLPSEEDMAVHMAAHAAHEGKKAPSVAGPAVTPSKSRIERESDFLKKLKRVNDVASTADVPMDRKYYDREGALTDPGGIFLDIHLPTEDVQDSRIHHFVNSVENLPEAPVHLDNPEDVYIYNYPDKTPYFWTTNTEHGVQDGDVFKKGTWVNAAGLRLQIFDGNRLVIRPKSNPVHGTEDFGEAPAEETVDALPAGLDAVADAVADSVPENVKNDTALLEDLRGFAGFSTSNGEELRKKLAEMLEGEVYNLDKIERVDVKNGIAVIEVSATDSDEKIFLMAEANVPHTEEEGTWDDPDHAGEFVTFFGGKDKMFLSPENRDALMKLLIQIKNTNPTCVYSNPALIENSRIARMERFVTPAAPAAPAPDFSALDATLDDATTETFGGDEPAAVDPVLEPAPTPTPAPAPRKRVDVLGGRSAVEVLYGLAETVGLPPRKARKIADSLKEKFGVPNGEMKVHQIYVENGVAQIDIEFVNPNPDEESKRLTLSATTDLPFSFENSDFAEESRGSIYAMQLDTGGLRESRSRVSNENNTALTKLFEQILDEEISLEDIQAEDPDAVRMERLNTAAKGILSRLYELQMTERPNEEHQQEMATLRRDLRALVLGRGNSLYEVWKLKTDVLGRDELYTLLAVGKFYYDSMIDFADISYYAGGIENRERFEIIPKLAEKSSIRKPIVIIKGTGVENGVAHMQVLFVDSEDPSNTEEIYLTGEATIEHSLSSNAEIPWGKYGELEAWGGFLTEENQSAWSNLIQEQILGGDRLEDTSYETVLETQQKRANELLRRARGKKQELDNDFVTIKSRFLIRSGRWQELYDEYAEVKKSIELAQRTGQTDMKPEEINDLIQEVVVDLFKVNELI